MEETGNQEIAAYRERAGQFLESSADLIEKQEFEKAGEFLWGAIASYINAIVYLRTGRAEVKHGLTIQSGKDIASAIEDVRLFKAIDTTGNNLHANFYHGFLTPESFKDSYGEVIYAIEKLEKVLQGELRPSRDS